MREYLLIVILLVFTSNSFGKKLYIVVNKGPFSSVYEAANSEEKVDFFDDDLSDERACTEGFAATELAYFLSKIIEIPIDSIIFIQPDELPEFGDIILLGSKESNKLIRKFKNSKRSKEFTSEQSFSIRTDKIKNQRLITIIEGSDRIGALYGVYRYLELYGLKFIGLGEKGIVYPLEKVILNKSFCITENPSYLTRGFWAWGDRQCDIDFFLWMARNKMNLWTEDSQPVSILKKLGVKLSAGGHNIQKLFLDPEKEYPYNHPLYEFDNNKPSDPYVTGSNYNGDLNKDGKLSYFEAHPEWYGLQNGIRSKKFISGGDNFCISNNDARKELARNMINSLISGDWKFVDIVNLWMLDYGNWCTCNNCTYYGNETDNLFLVANEILNEIELAKKKGLLLRNVELTSISYLKTLKPPTKPLPKNYNYNNSYVTFFPIGRCYAHAFADTMCNEINVSQYEAYKEWFLNDKSFYKGSLCIGEYYNISSFKSLPLIFSSIIVEDVPWYYDNNARHFHYMHVPTRRWGTWTLNQYLLSKILWNVDNDKKMLNLFFKDYYPTTYKTTQLFYSQVELASENMKLLKSYVHGTSWNFLNSKLLEGNMFEFEHMQFNTRSNNYNDAPSIEETIKAMENAKSLVDQSIAYCKDSIELQRLLEDRNRFEYGYYMYKYIYHMIRTSMFHKQRKIESAKVEFVEVSLYVEKLKEIIDIVNVSSEHANAKNGFEATESVQQFNKFKLLYGDKNLP